ncbi:DUF1667 domain-containing protein [Clostridium sp. MSJ-4]|uniref:DUF1667 domain-containing protein n=1 Tax=Clostridium simiarum TaxID=2841506 RepID=A0ABS6F4F6_9CLOT|nr:DUF1667 domain-containing protein [Clostridium simiarum]MBU5593401.1 DUF1667 domain-containing protein [Clostridium simiarum]
MIDKILCEECPKRCVLDIYKYEDEIEIKGNQCEVGIEYGIKRMRDNKRIFTTLVRMKGSSKHTVVPVKSSAPIDKSLWIECSKALSRLHVGPPISIGDIICKNILNTGVDIVCNINVKRD